MNLKQIAKCYQKVNNDELRVIKYRDKNDEPIVDVFYGRKTDNPFFSSLGLSRVFGFEVFVVSNKIYAPNLVSDVALAIQTSGEFVRVHPHILNVIFDDDDQHGIVVLRKNNNFFQNLDIDMFQIIELSLMESILYQNIDENTFWHEYDHNCLDFRIFNKYSETNEPLVSGILYDENFSLSDLHRVIHDNGANATWMGSPILLLIAQAGRFDLLKSILKHTSLDVNVIDSDGNTILHYLANNKNLLSSDILADIKKHDFNLYSWKNINGRVAIL